MFTTPTCLLLGAGASSHLDYPLGKDLVHRIVEISSSNRLRECWTDFPPESTWREFIDDLREGMWTSPDAYLEKNPHFLEMGKRAIAFVLKGKEHSGRLFRPNSVGWYEHLSDCLLSDTDDDIERFRENKLSIVTFNYDRTIEHYLHKVVKRRFRLDDHTAWQAVSETIPIVHVHGMIGEYPKVPYDSMAYAEAAESIKIIHEIPDGEGFATSDFKNANALLNQASRVFVFGFGFATVNVDRLRFFDGSPKPHVTCTIMAEGAVSRNNLEQRVRSLGVGRVLNHSAGSYVLEFGLL